MKKWIACSFLVATASLAAQAPMTKPAPMTKIVTEEDYMKAMKEVGPTAGVVRKTVGTPADADAAPAAARLSAIFTEVHAYWVGRKVDDAIAFAKTALDSTQAMSKALAAKDSEAAKVALTAMNGACMGCHAAHREQLPDKTYKMK